MKKNVNEKTNVNEQQKGYTTTPPPDKALEPPTTLKELEDKVLGSLADTLEATKRLADLRLQCKLSNSRVAGVARELKELIKVMEVYRK